MSVREEEYDDLLDVEGHAWRGRLIALLALAGIVAAIAAGLRTCVFSGDGETVASAQTTTVQRGSITASISTTGVVAAQSTADLSFEQSGRVSAVNVTLGQEVKKGDVLAEMEADELQESLATAQVNLGSAQSKLNQLLGGVDASDLASADQSLVQAQATLDQANRTLQDLYEEPSDSDRLSAEQAVASAEADLDQAIRVQEALYEGPSESQRLGAEQAVASGESSLAQAKASRAQLYSDREAAVAAAEEAVNKAEDALEDVNRAAEAAASSLASAEATLVSAETAYCLTPDYAENPSATVSFCAARAAPISSTDEAVLRDVTVNGAPELANQAASVLSANSSYVKALDEKEAADDAVGSAQEDLADSQRDLDEARQGPSSEDITKADAAVAAAELGLDKATAELAELYAGPTQDELKQAQASVGQAETELDLAEAKLAELNQGPTQSELDAAEDGVETAAAALAAAQAKRDDVYAGIDPEETQQQRNQVQLAALAVEGAQRNLKKAKLFAPFDGTVEEINIQVGESTGAAGEAAIVLNTPNAIRLDLTVTESDRPSVQVGQEGTATFDAIPDVTFPIVIESVGSNPTTTQGVVTYEVRASIGEGTAGLAGALAPGGVVEPSAGEPPSQIATVIAQGGGQIPPQAGTVIAQGGGQIPPQAGTAIAARGGIAPQVGTPTPAAAVEAGASPEGGAPSAVATPPAGAAAADSTSVQTALPGMNASVAIIVEQARDVLVVPDSAIQSRGPASVVEVQNDDGSTEMVVVETGLSDGTNTEVVSGLEEGQTVIVPVPGATTQGTTGGEFDQQGPFPGPGGGGPGGPIIIGGSP